MKIHTPEELSQIGLLPKEDSIATELVYFRDTKIRTDLFKKLGDDNKETMLWLVWSGQEKTLLLQMASGVTQTLFWQWLEQGSQQVDPERSKM